MARPKTQTPAYVHHNRRPRPRPHQCRWPLPRCLPRRVRFGPKPGKVPRLLAENLASDQHSCREPVARLPASRR